MRCAAAALIRRATGTLPSCKRWAPVLRVGLAHYRTKQPQLADEHPPGPDVLEGEWTWQEDPETGSPVLTAVDSEAGDVDEAVAGDDDNKKKAGPLARQMWKCARRGVRDEAVWAKFSQRVLMTGAFTGAADIALIFFAFARIKYRDTKALDSISPFILRHINDFSVVELALLLNAHKKLEYERVDSMQLLINAFCNMQDKWTGRAVSLATNAVAFFYVYQPRFWRKVAQALPKLVWTMNPLELSNTVSAMARVDRRETQILQMIGRMCRRCAQRSLFSQETLATTINALAKLDFNHPKLSKALEDAAVVKLDCALELGPDYRKSSLRGVDVFDVQALVLVLHSLVCLVGTSDEVIGKLLTLISWSRNEVSPYQCRTLKIACRVLRKQHGDLVRRLHLDVKNAMYVFEHSTVQVATYESRWSKELRQTLRKMDINLELKSLVDDQVLDIWLPSSNAAVYSIGPYGYYAGTTHRTAYSKLHQRLLEMEGYTCMLVPYYQWAELKTMEDKMVFLWSLGRRAAARGPTDETEAAPAVVIEEEELQSDLGILEAAPA